jgi:hypothetical protein
MPFAAQHLLIITGSMGSGKSTVMAEASDILTLRGISHASVDLDALATGHFPRQLASDDLMYRNLQSVWKNCAASGLTRLLLARALETSNDLERCRDAVSAQNTVVCRLVAAPETMQQRVRNREPGMLQAEFVQRSAELNATLDRAQLEDFLLVNEGISVTIVAQEMLTRAGWLPAIAGQ